MERNSSTLPGQPWKKAIGIAVGEVEKRARKWIVKSEPSGSVTGIVKFGNELMRSSHLLLFCWIISLDDPLHEWLEGMILPVISGFPMFLSFDEPVSVHTKSTIRLLVLICRRTNLRMSKQMFHRLDVVGIDFHLELFRLNLYSRRNLSIIGHDARARLEIEYAAVDWK